jgi:hypothetical protein
LIYNIKMQKENDKVPWSKWISDRYEEWRKGKRGNAASIAEFARQFGASHQVVLGWMSEDKETIPTKAKYVNALVAVYGKEIYTVLDIVGPDEEVISMDQIEPEDRAVLEAALRDAGLPVNSEEDLARAIKAFEAHGIKVTRKR